MLHLLVNVSLFPRALHSATSMHSGKCRPAAEQNILDIATQFALLYPEYEARGHSSTSFNKQGLFHHVIYS